MGRHEEGGMEDGIAWQLAWSGYKKYSPRLECFHYALLVFIAWEWV